ncbi:O-methyltransferase [Auricularia subglabra TFB-10046 SS5]|nr:O-methyltransferase [Auricularia subglabra TFB-10046 SS5]
MAQTLLALSELISTSVKQIDEICKAKKSTFPALDEPFTPASEAIRADPAVAGAIALLVAAAEQLVATAWNPAGTVAAVAISFHLPSALRFATTCNVAEALREAGPKGLHVDEISKGLPVAPQKLARTLRLLATKHIFREVAPDVFANNRLSSTLDTGKSLAQLRADPVNKHQGTLGFAALVEHCTDEMFKTSAYMTEVLTDPATAKSEEPDQTPVQRAFRTKLTYWDWMDLPENEHVLKRFGMAMVAAKLVSPPNTILEAFKWDSLPKGATVVDVGGGVGSVTHILAEKYPDLRYVVQDRAKTIEPDARNYWNEHMPEALSSGKVTLEAHDFFAEQPRKSPDVFILRFIVHDWSDPYASKILKHLRNAAGDKTQLVLLDQIVPYACRHSDTTPTQIPGGETTFAPEPLLANMGSASIHKYYADMQMLIALNAQERTLPHFDRLLRETGWKIERVHQTPGAAAQIIARPA